MYCRTVSVFILCTAMGVAAAHAGTEYFVGKQGNNTHDGLGRQTAFATIQKGVDTLQPGDTLTILPGEYHETVRRDGLGSLETQTLIRADIPGTAILRGDLPVSGFRPVKGYRFVYVADFISEAPVSAVNELDTLKVLKSQPNAALLDITPGSYHHDTAGGKLYVSASTLNAATDHAYSASVMATHGLYLSNAKRVVVDGLGVTGFNNIALQGWREGTHGSVYGMFINNGKSCVFRNCLAWFNGGGIGLNSHSEAAGDNVIERCTAWGNRPQFSNEDPGGLTLYMTRRDVIRDSTAFANTNYGVNIYGTHESARTEPDRSRLVNNLAWDNAMADIKTKGGPFAAVEHSAGLGQSSVIVAHTHHSIVNQAGADAKQMLAQGNINMADHPNLDVEAAFADPVNHDYRLQSTSPFRGAGPDGTDLGPTPYEANIFYVRIDGDDAADGLSMSTAWRSVERAVRQLPAGATLYVSGGSYTMPTEFDLPARATLRGRGADTVTLQGTSTITAGEHLTLERLTFADPVTLQQSSKPTIAYCRFTGLRARGVDQMRLTRTVFTKGKLELIQSKELHLTGNIFESGGASEAAAVVLDNDSTVLYSDYNVYEAEKGIWSSAGRTLDFAELQTKHDRYSRLMEGLSSVALLTRGPYGISRQGRTKSESKLIGPFIHSVTDTTANIEWWTTAPTNLTVVWGETDAMINQTGIQANRFGTFSLKGLKPGTTYQFKLIADAMPGQGQTLTFTTAGTAAQAHVYYVAPDGDDAHTGLTREQAWRTVVQAADRVRPGDTVLIAGGTYHEMVRLRATGERGRPITFKAMPGQKVQFDGMDRALTYVFYAADKHHLHFDGLYFTGYDGITSREMPWSSDSLNPGSGTFNLYRSDDIQITRCFSDGRGAGYSPGLAIAVHCRDLHLQNNVIIKAMGGGGLSFYGCPNLHVQNSVFLVNMTANIGEGVNEPDQPFYLHHNIFTDNIHSKVHVDIFSIGKVEAMVETDNAYLLRWPDEKKRMWQFYSPTAYDRCAVAFRLNTSFEQPPAIVDLTRMSQAEYKSRFHPENRSMVADPGFAATVGVKPLDRRGEPMFMPDYLLGKADLDFPDLFATNPEVVERGIGLQPEAFRDFHFADKMR